MNRDEVLQAVDILDVIIQRIGPLKKKGAEYVACCPFHDEKTPSFSVSPKKQIFKCFGCGAGGDAIEFVIRHDNLDFLAAVKALTGNNTPDAHKPVTKAEPEDPQRIPPQNSVPNFQHSEFGEPVRIWTYRNAAGQITGYIGRYQGPDRKEIIPLTYRSKGWVKKGFDKPRHLYNLDQLTTRTDYKSVLLVEGEPAADAAAKLFPTLQVVTWQGGTGAVGYTDFSPLTGKRVILCPDNDREQKYPKTHPKANQVKPYHEQSGPKAMHQIAAMLSEMEGTRLLWLDAPEGSPDKWDWADFTGTQEQALDYLKANAKPYTPYTPEAEPEPEPKPEPKPKPARKAPENPPPPPPVEPKADGEINGLKPQFRPLGHNKSENGQSEFYFFSSKAGQVLTFRASNFTKTGVMQLDDLTFFEHLAPARGGPDMEIVAQWLINQCYLRGVYNPTNTRGIGAWMDEGRVVIHSGDHLIVNKEKMGLHEIKSKFLYEANEPFGFQLTDPLHNAEAAKLQDLVEMMNWERKINAYLFTGWCILAPVCGSLKWRPHIWLTGGRGTGKSTALNIMRKIIGKMAIHVQGVTSEAGIRQTLLQDARPVLFDEADTDNRADIDRIQSILALMRSSSTHDGGDIIKGGQSGNSKAYRIRSCFAFASINPQVANAADSSRVTILSLFKPAKRDEQKSQDNWKKMQGMMAELLTDRFCERLLSRTIDLLPIILENADTFARAAASVLGEQRAGDQLGALLAGAYSLKSRNAISYNDAVEWVQNRADDWEFVSEGRNVRDEVMLLNHILEQQIIAENGGGYKHERTIGELVEVAYKGNDPTNSILKEDAAQKLRRMGMKVNAQDLTLIISNKHAQISKMLDGTPWAKRHSDLLARLDGAKSVASTKFGPGIQTRAVSIPLSLIMDVDPSQIEITFDDAPTKAPF